MTTENERAAYIAGLRALADLLEAHDELPAPYNVNAQWNAQWIVCSKPDDEQRRIAQMFTRLMPGTITKGVRDTAFDLDGKVGAVEVGMILTRDAVCTRVVHGTREVTEEVPDPDALAAVPTTTVTRTEEIAEWVCQPLLADRAIPEPVEPERFDMSGSTPGADR